MSVIKAHAFAKKGTDDEGENVQPPVLCHQGWDLYIAQDACLPF